MTEQQIIEALNAFRPDFLDLMGCTITGADPVAGRCTMTFDIGKQYCHSGDIVQGGFVTAMLDAVSTHAVFASQADVVGVSSLEIKTSYLDVTRAGKLTATGLIQRAGRSIAFLTAELFNEAGEMTATVSTTAKLRRKSA